MRIKWFSIVAIAALALAGCSPQAEPAGTTGGPAQSAEKPKIGFIVKSMADSWFQVETKFAKEKADELGAELLVQEAKSGEDVQKVIDTMATQGVKGLIICSPEVQLGEAIRIQCEGKGIKLMSVDDRLEGTDEKPIESIPHLGISAGNIGKMVGETMVAEMKARGWNMAEVGAIAVLKEDLQTARDRVNGAKDALIASGFPESSFYIASWGGAVDIASAADAAKAVITRNAGVKHWLCLSSNDDGMVGAVRALAERGVKAADVIGVGINGKLAAQEFKNTKESGVFASVMLKPSVHGGKTVEMMVAWIKEGKQPEMLTLTDGSVITRQNYETEIVKEGITLD